MDYGKLMMDGVMLMVFGMGMVYVFLIIMIQVMKLLQVVLAPFADALEAPKPAAAPAAPTRGNDVKLAAIAAAVVANEIK